MTAPQNAPKSGTDKKAPAADKVAPPPAADKVAPPSAADVAPATTAATTAAPTATDAAAPEVTDGEPKERRRIYIVIGEVRDFKNAAEAEKYLNKDPNAPKDYTVIKGKKVEGKAKVSLR